MQMRRAIIGVITFLITPGLFLMMKTMSGYELMVKVARARNMPQLIEGVLAQMAVLFVSYSMISTGLLTAFIWDTLVFDKRDAMVLGPLPLRRPHDRGREARRAGDVSRRYGSRRQRHIRCVVRVRDRRHRRPHSAASRRPLVRHDWRRDLHVLHARGRPRTAGAARQRARRRDGGLAAAVRLPHRRAVLHDGADRDRAGVAADFLVRCVVRDDSRLPPAVGRPTRAGRAHRAAAIDGRRDRRHVCRLLETDARRPCAVGSRRGHARGSGAASPR